MQLLLRFGLTLKKNEITSFKTNGKTHRCKEENGWFIFHHRRASQSDFCTELARGRWVGAASAASSNDYEMFGLLAM